MIINQFCKQLLLIIFAFIFSTQITKADTIGVITSTEIGTFKIGLDIYNFSKGYELEGNEDIDIDGNRYGIKGEYSFSEILSFYAKIGIFDISSKDLKLVSNFYGAKKEFETDSGVGFGAGFKTTLVNQKDFKFGISFQTLYYSADKDNLVKPIGLIEENSGYGYGGAYYTSGKSIETKITEFNLVLAGSYNRIENLNLYGGFMFSKVDADIKVTETMPNPEQFEGYSALSSYKKQDFIEDYYFEEQQEGYHNRKREKENDCEGSDPIGIVLGALYSFNGNFEVGIETILVSETSFALNFGYVF